MSEGRPLWLKAVLSAERTVGSRIETAVHSDRYFDLITTTQRTTRRVGHLVEGVSKRVLHLGNLPAGTDIRVIRAQLTRMERRIVALSKELDEQRQALEVDALAPDPLTPRTPPPGKTTRRPASGKTTPRAAASQNGEA